MTFGLPAFRFTFNEGEDQQVINVPGEETDTSQTVGGRTFKGKLDQNVLMQLHCEVSPDDDRFHNDSYKGGKHYIKRDYLHTHSKEKQEDFSRRKTRSYFYNYCRPVIDSFTYFLFKSNPTRTSNGATAPDVMKFIADPTKGTEDLNDVMKHHAFTLLKLGRSWLKMDTPAFSPISKADEQYRESLPYIYHYPAEDVLDWAEGEEGALRWVKVWDRRDNKVSFDYDGATVDNIKIWYPEAVGTYAQDGNLISVEENLLGMVPFILTKLNENMQSFISDISITNQSIYNWCSLLDEILYKQTFSQLVVPGDAKQALSEKRVGIASAFTFDPNAKHAPHFIQPDPKQGDLIQRQIDDAIKEIYRAAQLEWVDSQRATNKSGSAKQFDFQNTNKVLGGIASSLEQTEKNIFKMYNKLRGNEEAEATAPQYPRDFSVAALESELSNMFFAITRRISPTLNKLMKKRAASLLLPRMSEKDKVTIEKEIDEAPELTEEEVANANARVQDMISSASSTNLDGPKSKIIEQSVD
jgi:hypothetical protein